MGRKLILFAGLILLVLLVWSTLYFITVPPSMYFWKYSFDPSIKADLKSSVDLPFEYDSEPVPSLMPFEDYLLIYNTDSGYPVTLDIKTGKKDTLYDFGTGYIDAISPMGSYAVSEGRLVKKNIEQSRLLMNVINCFFVDDTTLAVNHKQDACTLFMGDSSISVSYSVMFYPFYPVCGILPDSFRLVYEDTGSNISVIEKDKDGIFTSKNLPRGFRCFNDDSTVWVNRFEYMSKEDSSQYEKTEEMNNLYMLVNLKSREEKLSEFMPFNQIPLPGGFRLMNEDVYFKDMFFRNRFIQRESIVTPFGKEYILRNATAFHQVGKSGTYTTENFTIGRHLTGRRGSLLITPDISAIAFIVEKRFTRKLVVITKDKVYNFPFDGIGYPVGWVKRSS